jgi:hypothetical protein
MRFIFTIYIFFTTFLILGQQPDPDSLVIQLKTELEKVKSYRVDMEVEVDVDFINMPIKHATMFFKYPDKVKFKSDEFIMLPKKGLNNGLHTLLSMPYTSIYLGSETLFNEDHHVVKVIPLTKKPDIILTTLWINKSSLRVSKSENNTRNQGTFTVEFAYTNSTYALPSEISISFEIENLKIPLKFIGKSAGIEIDKDKLKEKQEGKVYIRFSNYMINELFDESIFTEED